jgi:hypothetical protein
MKDYFPHKDNFLKIIRKFDAAYKIKPKPFFFFFFLFKNRLSYCFEQKNRSFRWFPVCCAQILLFCLPLSVCFDLPNSLFLCLSFLLSFLLSFFFIFFFFYYLQLNPCSSNHQFSRLIGTLITQNRQAAIN